MFASKDTLLTRPSGGYTIARSVRLRSSASGYFARTPSSASNLQKWTWSGWVKRGKLGSPQQTLFSAQSTTTANLIYCYFSTTDALTFYQYSASGATTDSFLGTTQVFRDPSAWYHIVVSVDTTQATSSNRTIIYVNGVQVTSFSATTYFTQNTNTYINSTNPQNIARNPDNSSYFDGYLTEINFVDGQQLTPSSFGETDSITGVWKPKAYSGTYGTNGFELNFSDNSNNTAATIGKDYSGNGNNWTPNNISVTAGVTYDSMQDVPTLTSATAANYCVGNPLYVDGSVSVTWTNGNLTWSCPNTGSGKATISATTGKFYWEAIYLTNAFMTGVSDVASVGRYNNSILYQSDGTKGINGTFTSYGATYTTGDVIGVALDLDGGTVTFYKNNSSQGSISLSLASITNATAIVVGGGGFSNTGNWNFGQRPFSYTPPTGFVALNTYNLPASTIKNGAAYMAATLWTGNGTARSISNAVGSTSFQSDMVWIKARNQTFDHQIWDIVRGPLVKVAPNSTAAESSIANSVTSFNSNGFGLGDTATVNLNGGTFVGWNWKAGGTAVSNTNGTITSTVSVGATQGFSVATYTGNGSAGATFGHGLGVAPSFVIIKERGNANGWLCYHISTGNTGYLELDATLSFQTLSTFLNNTTPSSSVVTLGTVANVNRNGGTFVAYCFAAVAGYSAFGSYTGAGNTGASSPNANGPFVYTGFRPRFVLIKRTSSAADWEIFDSSRGTYNANQPWLQPNTSSAESSSEAVDFLSNGFKIRAESGALMYPDGATFIYAAFAENPFKNSLAR